MHLIDDLSEAYNECIEHQDHEIVLDKVLSYRKFDYKEDMN